MSPGFVVNPSACFQPISRLSILNVSPTVVLSENAFRIKAKEEAEHCSNPVDRLRLLCLSMGFSTPKLLIRKLIELDEEQIKEKDLANVLASTGLEIRDEDIKNAFGQMAEGGEQIQKAKIVQELMPPINAMRRSLIEQVFSVMDPQGKGSVPLSALCHHFNHRRHPQFESGTKSREELYAAFLDQFQPNPDGQILAEEFLAFYVGLRPRPRGGHPRRGPPRGFEFHPRPTPEGPPPITPAPRTSTPAGVRG